MTRVTDGLRNWRRRTLSCGGGLCSWNIKFKRLCNVVNARPPSRLRDKVRRRREHRQHPGAFRPQPPADTKFIEHDVHPQACQHCGGSELEATGQLNDHIAAEIPEPKLEWHRYRRHIYRCLKCQQTCQGRGELELPGSHIGPRARLLTCYSRAHLGISLGKTQDLLHDFFGLTVSRAGLLGHLRWGGALFEPVVDELFERLCNSPVVGADEIGREQGEILLFQKVECPLP